VTIKLEVFDPAMCCSSGVCGPGVDPELSRFAGDLKWLSSRGISVARFNLAQQPAAFVANVVVNAALKEDETCLPLVLLDGRIVSSKRYPTRDELAASAGLTEDSPGVAAAETSSCCGADSTGRSGSKCCG
jgi:hypothetical protein